MINFFSARAQQERSFNSRWFAGCACVLGYVSVVAVMIVTWRLATVPTAM